MHTAIFHHFRFWLLLAAALYAGASKAEATALDALLMAGEQRVLSQRLLKTYAQIGQEVRFLAARSEHKQSIERFDETLAKLKTYNGGGGFSQALTEVEAEWVTYKQAVSAKPTAADASAVEAHSNKMADATDRLYQSIASTTKLPQEHIFNLVNLQMKMAQHAAAHYLLTSWGVDKDHNRTIFKETLADFDSNMVELSTAPENNQDTVAALKSLNKKWGLFKDGHRVDDDGHLPDFVVRICDSSTALLDDALHYYLKAEIPEE